MPRFIPPHLMVLVAVLIFVLWIMLVHRFRNSSLMQRFVSEIFGDDTPASALRAFSEARCRLAKHLNDEDLDGDTRRQIELALGTLVENRTSESREDDCLTRTVQS